MNNQKSAKQKKQPRRKRPPRSRAGGAMTILVQPNVKRILTWSHTAVLNNAAQVGTNVTYALYKPSSLSPNVIGLTSLYGGSGNTGQYNSNRVIGVRAKVSISNQEAFGVRVMAVLSSQNPANASLVSETQQLPYMSRTGGVMAFDTVGPLTGQSRVDLKLRATNRSLFGVRHVPGIADNYTNSWSSDTDAAVAATTGISLIILVFSAVNLVNGILYTVETEMTTEFFSLNQNRPS